MNEDYVQIYDDYAEEILNFLEVWDDFDGRSYEDEREWKREIVGTALAKGWELRRDKMAYEIGQKIWFKGDQVEITSGPYELYGGMFQDAITEEGKAITLATLEQKKANLEQNQKERLNQQKQFRKLNE